MPDKDGNHTSEEWAHRMVQRHARLIRLRAMKAPQNIIDGEKKLMVQAAQNFCKAAEEEDSK